MSNHPTDITLLKDHLLSTPSRPEANIALLGAGGFTVGHYCETYDPTSDDPSPCYWDLYSTGRKVRVDWIRIETEDTPLQYPDSRFDDDPLSYGVDWMRKMDGCLLVFSCTSQRTLEHIKGLYEAFNRTADGETAKKKKIFLVASKIDLIDDPECPEARQVVEDAQQFCDEKGLTLLKMSAKTEQGCSNEEVQNIVLHVLLQRIKGEGEPEENAQPENRNVAAKFRSVARKLMRRERS